MNNIHPADTAHTLICNAVLFITSSDNNKIKSTCFDRCFHVQKRVYDEVEQVKVQSGVCRIVYYPTDCAKRRKRRWHRLCVREH